MRHGAPRVLFCHCPKSLFGWSVSKGVKQCDSPVELLLNGRRAGGWKRNYSQFLRRCVMPVLFLRGEGRRKEKQQPQERSPNGHLCLLSAILRGCSILPDCRTLPASEPPEGRVLGPLVR